MLKKKCDYKDCVFFLLEPESYVSSVSRMIAFYPAVCIQCVNLNRDRPNYEKRDETEDGECTCGLHL